MDFRGEPTARAAEGLALLPPFAPAAGTCVRMIVESNIWSRWSDGLRDARLVKKAANTLALQVNIRGGRLPEPESNGRRYPKIPIGALDGAAWGP